MENPQNIDAQNCNPQDVKLTEQETRDIHEIHTVFSDVLPKPRSYEDWETAIKEEGEHHGALTFWQNCAAIYKAITIDTTSLPHRPPSKSA
jgi:hypothetical protein